MDYHLIRIVFLSGKSSVVLKTYFMAFERKNSGNNCSEKGATITL